MSELIRNNDGTYTLKITRKGTRLFLKAFFQNRYNLKFKMDKVKFNTEKEAQECLKYLRASLIPKWGYEFSIDKTVLKAKIVHLHDVIV